jgi:hypothetical protein
MSYAHEQEEQENLLARAKPAKPFSDFIPDCSYELWGLMDRYLAGRGLSPSLARLNFWFPSAEVDGVPRVVVPATSTQPGNLYWQARVISLPGSRSYGPKTALGSTIVGGGATPVSPRRWESPHGVRRGDALVVVWPVETPAYAVVVEGPMDALAAGECGALGVALMGATPPDEVLLHLGQLVQGLQVLAVMDSDEPKAMTRVVASLRGYATAAKLIDPYPFKDLAEAAPARRKGILQWES